MLERNRFSRLLKYLLSFTNVKNYTLAKKLQYDVSYISKWVSGQKLPAEKNKDTVIRQISECVVEECCEETVEKLLQRYKVNNTVELKTAIFDNLEAEYNYVRELQNNLELNDTSGYLCFPEMQMREYLKKIHHPVLRRVSNLEIIEIIDLFAIDRCYWLSAAAGTGKIYVPEGKWYEDVHYTLVIDINLHMPLSIRDIYFFIEVLGRNSYIDFRFYISRYAVGKIVFSVKNEYIISCLLVGGDSCMSVMSSERRSNCQMIYKKLRTLYSSENALFRKTTIGNILAKEYVNMLFALRQQWIIGYMTEHFVPEDLLEEILPPFCADGTFDIDKLRNIHKIIRNVLREVRISILIDQDGLYELAVNNVLDFFNCKITLTNRQVIRYLENLQALINDNSKSEIKIMRGGAVLEKDYKIRSCVFIGDSTSYLRLNTEYNNLYLVNHPYMRESFEKMFSELWDDKRGICISGREEAGEMIKHILNGVYAERDNEEL